MIGIKQNAWKLVRHFATGGDEACLRRLLGRAPAQAEIDALLDELPESPEMVAAMDCAAYRAFAPETTRLAPVERLAARLDIEGGGRARAVLLYVTARLLRPEVVVETGCFTGWDSSLLLQALDRNGHGRLYSIDLPAREGAFSQRGPRCALPQGLPMGFLVPEPFRARWTLIEADIRRELMPLLARIGPVGLFLHDSDHTYPHMMWEYTSILPQMAAGGVIVSDDIAWNTAFWDFAAALGQRPVIHASSPNVGAIPVARAGAKR